jgi:hypothetical protein
MGEGGEEEVSDSPNQDKTIEISGRRLPGTVGAELPFSGSTPGLSNNPIPPMYHPVRRYLRLPVTIAGRENNSSPVSPKMAGNLFTVYGIGLSVSH